MLNDDKELLPIVDESGNVIGRNTRECCHNGSKLLHPIVYLHVFDKDGRLYLQRRPNWKKIEPNKWDVAVGGHINYGEDIISALNREALEELGLVNFNIEHLKHYIYESDIEKEFVNSFKTVVEPIDVKPSEELDGGKWWTIEELLSDDKEFTPNLKNELKILGIYGE